MERWVDISLSSSGLSKIIIRPKNCLAITVNRGSSGKTNEWMKDYIPSSSKFVDHWNTKICTNTEEQRDALQGENVKDKYQTNTKGDTFIFLGSNDIPQYQMVCAEYNEDNNKSDINEAMHSCRKLHPEWRIHEKKSDLFSGYDDNQYLSAKKRYEEAMHNHNYGMSSDVARIFFCTSLGCSCCKL